MRYPRAAFSLVVLIACLSASPAAAEGGIEPSVLVGAATREAITEAVPDWALAEAESSPDPEAAQALAAVEPGARVDVVLGTWCEDSRREVPRLWRALDLAGPVVPFEVRYLGVGRDKKEPADLVAASGILYVPTVIVTRDGEEVGRIVEESPHGIERDLLDLLAGRARGVITTRTDLAPPGPSR